MTHVVLVKGESGAQTARLAEAVASLPDVKMKTHWTMAHAAAEGGLLLSVVVKGERVRLEWGRPYRAEDTSREIEWLTGTTRPVPRVHDPEARKNGGGKGAKVMDAEAVAALVAAELRLPPSPDLVTALHDTADRTTEAEADLARARAERDAAVKAAMAGGVPVQTVMDATGLSRPRLYQLMDRGEAADLESAE